MITHAILFTPFEGTTVKLDHPSPEIFRVLSLGGFWALCPRGFREEQIELQILDGRDPDASRRWADAVLSGGLSEAEIWALLRDRNCLHQGKDFELVARDDLPTRWFRNAWARGRNGGVAVDLDTAKDMQLNHISAAERWASAAPKTLKRQAKRARVFWREIRAGLRRACSVSEVARVWPDGFEKPMELLTADV